MKNLKIQKKKPVLNGSSYWLDAYIEDRNYDAGGEAGANYEDQAPVEKNMKGSTPKSSKLGRLLKDREKARSVA